MKNLFYIIAAAIIFIFTSCEKVIELDLQDNAAKLVIEGNITDGEAPYYVTLTQSLTLSETGAYPIIDNATVIISDDVGTQDTLTHIANGKYRTHKTLGTQGRTYFLKVIVAGKTYQAMSKIPEKIAFDSLKSMKAQLPTGSTNIITPVYKDASILGNSYRFVLNINGEPIKDYFVWNDNTNNGGINTKPLRTNGTIKSGDVVSVEMQSIDETAYLYYFALSQLAGNGPGGGTTPSNPPNNISGGALGLFSAHTSQSKSIVIP